MKTAKSFIFVHYFRHQLRVFRLYLWSLNMLSHFEATAGIKMSVKHAKKKRGKSWPRLGKEMDRLGVYTSLSLTENFFLHVYSRKLLMPISSKICVIFVYNFLPYSQCCTPFFHVWPWTQCFNATIGFDMIFTRSWDIGKNVSGLFRDFCYKQQNRTTKNENGDQKNVRFF